MMGEVYRRCNRVIVYLGDRLNEAATNYEHSPPIRTFGDINKSQPVSEDHSPSIVDVFSLVQQLSLQDVTHLEDLPVFKDAASERTRSLFEGLRRLMHPPFTPWWNRIWVIQEVLAPETVMIMYGNVSAPWSMFAKAAREYHRHSTSCCSDTVRDNKLPRDQRKVLVDFSNRILDIDALRLEASDVNWRRVETPQGVRVMYRHPRNYVRRKQSLLALLRYFRDRQASDPRDKIYALLTLVTTPENCAPLQPDYSLSEVEVWANATLYCIQESESLSVLSTELSRKFRNDLPSWVPDWGAPGSLTFGLRGDMVELYDTCAKTIASWTVNRNSMVLDIKGRRVDKVQDVGETMWGEDPVSCRMTLQDWWYLMDVRKDLRHCFWRIVCADIIYDASSNKKLRRTQPEDELDFVLWASKSDMSPFTSYTMEAFWSQAATAWGHVRELWPMRSVLVPEFLDSSTLR